MTEVFEIVWFRQDLRILDNPALFHAASRENKILPVYILDGDNAGDQKMGGASRVWLHYALDDLDTSLDGHLQIYKGCALEILKKLASTHNISAIHWNRCYEPWRIERDQKIKKTLKEAGVEVHSYNASLLWEPWEPLKEDKTPYKVFTPFYRNGCLKTTPPRKPYPKPKKVNYLKGDFKSLKLKDLGLLPQIKWDRQMLSKWNITEKASHNLLEEFISNGLKGYKEGRNCPAQHHVSRLSPYLHFGQISPHHIWYAVQELSETNDSDCFLSEIGWREFSYSLLYHNPELPRKNLQKKFDHFPWRDDSEALKRWQKGMTGYPIVDAGMRELWQTGYMHNRVRMIVGSFLVKNLLLHWHEGEKWFWDCLFDADLANNSASWQWVAGCGADAAPYFRIFNPVTQGQKFDPEGEYTRRYVPELKNLPDKYLFNPWDAPKDVLKKAGVELGKNYPDPIVELKGSRERALAAFKTLS